MAPRRYHLAIQPSSHLRLLPDPVVWESALESSSLVTSDWTDGIAASVGAMLLIGSVGYGIYYSALLESDEESLEGTADDAVPLEEREKPKLEEVRAFGAGSDQASVTSDVVCFLRRNVRFRSGPRLVRFFFSLETPSFRSWK